MDLFKRAAEIASVVPEPMQEAAFHRALDALQKGSAVGGGRAKAHSSQKGPGGAQHHAPADAAELLSNLERSRAADVDLETSALGKSLALMRVAERELGIERLSAAQIANTLRDKFRWTVTRQGVNWALDEAGRFVDRRKDGRTATYRLVQAGEDWLDTPVAERETSKTKGRTRTSSKAVPRKAAVRSVWAEPAATEESNRSGVAGSKTRRKVGPKQALGSLVDAGYFSTPRTLSAVREKLQHDKALRFKPTDLSPAFTRLLREGRLARTRNTDGQYEYVASGA